MSTDPSFPSESVLTLFFGKTTGCENWSTDETRLNTQHVIDLVLCLAFRHALIGAMPPFTTSVFAWTAQIAALLS